MDKFGAAIRNGLANFRARVGADRGALMGALIMTMVATTGIVVALSWFMFRSTIDYNTGQQAKVKSSIGQLAVNVLGSMNQDFPDDWQFMNAEDLADATKDFGATDELGATSHLTFFAINPVTGVVTAEAVGTSTVRSSITSKARIQFVPSGAGVYKGVDDVGRPLWVYSNDNLDALALWELNPNSIEYLTPGGDYTTEAPPNPPAVDITGAGASATVKFSNVYCQFGGTSEFRYRYKYGAEPWSEWGTWATTQQYIHDIEQGQKISVQAMARCTTSLGNTDATAPSDIAEYVHPIAPPEGAPDLTISDAGVASWTSIECVGATVDQYQYRTRINESSWATWSSWTASQLDYNTGATEGSRVEVQVRARCASEFANGGTTATASASRDLPITSVPARPTVTFNGSTTVTISVGAAATVEGLTSEYRFSVSVNDAAPIWGNWSSSRAFDRTFNQGTKVQVRAEARYVSNYVNGAASTTSVNATHNVPVTTIPQKPVLTIAPGFNNWGFNNVSCVAGTTPGFTWTVTVGGSVVSSETYAEYPGLVQAISIPQGQQVVAKVKAACVGYNNLKGPYSAEDTLTALRSVTSTPSIPSVNFTTTGGASWTKAGCPVGTTWESRYQWKKNGSDFGAWTGWSTGSNISSPIGQGERVAMKVEARCTSIYDTSMSGPTASYSSPWHVYEITTQPTTGGVVSLAGNGPVTATFTNPNSCPATTSVRVAYRTTVNGAAWPGASAFATSITPKSIAASQGEIARAQMAAYCMTSYSEGPTFWYTAVTRTTPVTINVNANPTVTWASNYTYFQFTAEACASGLTPQFSYRTKLSNGSWSGYSSFAGRPSSVAISGWTPGLYHHVQLKTRCYNSYSGAVGTESVRAEVSKLSPLGTPNTPVLSMANDSSMSWSVSGCAVAPGVVTETRSRVRGNAGTGVYNNDSIAWGAWSGWSETVKTRAAFIDQGSSGQSQVEARCRHTPSNTIGDTSPTAQAGWQIRSVLYASTSLYMPRPHTVYFGGTCPAGTYLRYVQIRVNKAAGTYSWGPYEPGTRSWSVEVANTAYWSSNYAGNSRTYCQGPYTSGPWTYASYQAGSGTVPWW